jgi:hypothetical protein
MEIGSARYAFVQSKEPIMTREEVARLNELLDKVDPSRDSVDDVLRRIGEKLPHLTTGDVAEVIEVWAEIKRMEMAEQIASVEGETQILEILSEAERISEREDLTVGMAVQILADRAAQGDQEAAALLEQFDQAVRLLVTNCPPDEL